MDSAVTFTTLQSLGFATGAALCGQLWWSQRGFAPAFTQRHYGPLWLVGFWWNAACFAQHVMKLVGLPAAAAPVAAAEWLAWGSTCCGPLLIVRITVSASAARRVLMVTSMLTGAVLAALWVAVGVGALAMTLDAFSVVALYASLAHALVCVALYWLGPRSAHKSPQRRWLLRIAAALSGIDVSAVLLSIYAPAEWVSLRVLAAFISQQWATPWALLLATLLAHVHYADLILKRSATLLAAVAAATLLAWWIPGLPYGMPVLVASLVGAALLLLAPALHRAIHTSVDRGLLGRPDYADLQRNFVDAAAGVADRAALFTALERSLGAALHLAVRVLPVAQADAATTLLRVGLDEEHCIELMYGVQARTLLQEEHSFIDAVRAASLRRLQALELERQRREQQLREERLQRSVAEAELRALRAQVDPHFLFNTLNTIAELIGKDAQQAEAMTERLAEFFRYTLTRQERVLTTLAEELEFVRHYLEIERVRFGERLHVELLQDAAVGGQQVPALILQPLVENAVRHGLAPKVGPGSICVSASYDGEFLQLQVEDNGVGMQASAVQRPGVGLRNVRERLRALYQESAAMSIGCGAHGCGTRVTLLLPRRAEM